jgi:hypothetical protein
LAAFHAVKEKQRSLRTPRMKGEFKKALLEKELQSISQRLGEIDDLRRKEVEDQVSAIAEFDDPGAEAIGPILGGIKHAVHGMHSQPSTIEAKRQKLIDIRTDLQLVRHHLRFQWATFLSGTIGHPTGQIESPLRAIAREVRETPPRTPQRPAAGWRDMPRRFDQRVPVGSPT